MFALRQKVNFVNQRVSETGIVQAIFAVLAAAVIAIAALGSQARAAAAAPDVISAPDSGAAIFGYDPVAYFIEGAAQPGAAAFDVPEGRLHWRFQGEANRQAFLADPESFKPQFGGHDPVLAAKGVASAGDPEIFLVRAGRLFFFRNTPTRDAFLADSGIAGQARAAWPTVADQLTH